MPLETDLDRALAQMNANPEDANARLGFHARLAAAELFLVLEEEPAADDIRPLMLETSQGRMALAFDTEERMAGFMGRITPYAALAGRRIAAMFAGERIGLALNVGTEAEWIVDAPTIDWMADALRDVAAESEGRISELTKPGRMPEDLLRALDARLAAMAGIARSAWLSGVVYEEGTRGHLLSVIGAPEAARPAIAEAVGEALRLSGIEAGQLDIAFFAGDDPIVERLSRVGLRFDLPDLLDPKQGTRAAPGSDPSKPPILK
ncbi:MAG: SseB family protein [Rubricella sp.]